jgi:hypothetical protein
MTLIRANPLTFPKPEVSTGVRRLEAWKRGPPRVADVSPGLNLPLLRAKYGPQNIGKPRPCLGQFNVPRTTDWAVYERARNEKVNAWVQWMRGQGWEWTGGRVLVKPSDIPAQLEDGTPDPDSQVMEVITTFVYRLARVVRVELDPVLLQPTYPAGTRGVNRE